MISDVVIAGAGIGGLTLAVALRRRGVRVTILERASELGPAGAGLGLASNAVKAFERLGLASAIEAAGVVIARSAILDARGQILGREFDVARICEEIGAPTVALHRARLHDVLLEAVGHDVIRTGTPVAAYEQHTDHVTVVGAAGERIDTKLLVGADGLHSRVRAQLVGDGEPVYSGYTSWRGVTPAGSVPAPPRMSESWGHGERFGIVDIGFGEIYWFAVADAPAGGHDRDVRRELLARFGGWHEPIASIIEATPITRIVRTDISDRPAIDRWHDGRVVLLGDAAHPMTPNLGQGAGQAIEDAVVLEHCLSVAGSLGEGLRAYEQRRVTRANGIVRASRWFGAVAQWRNPMAAWLRNTGMRFAPMSFNIAQARRLMQIEL